MMCEECGKRPARMAVTMITSGKATTRRLCPQCAARLQRAQPVGCIESALRPP